MFFRLGFFKHGVCFATGESNVEICSLPEPEEWMRSATFVGRLGDLALNEKLLVLSRDSHQAESLCFEALDGADSMAFENVDGQLLIMTSFAIIKLIFLQKSFYFFELH